MVKVDRNKIKTGSELPLTADFQDDLSLESDEDPGTNEEILNQASHPYAVPTARQDETHNQEKPPLLRTFELSPQNIKDAQKLTDLGSYPCWLENVPITQRDIYEVIQYLGRKFGFQRSSLENIYDHLLTQLDSRASRASQIVALTSLHASYIGGDNSNYKKWFFAAQFDLDEDLGFSMMKLQGKGNKRNREIARQKNIDIKEQIKKFKENEEDFASNYLKSEFTEDQLERSFNFEVANYKWKQRMHDLTPREQIEQIALYLLIWGEANQVRFLPECICFIYKCAYDYYISDECRMSKEVLNEFHFLDHVITPIYRFLRNQIYTVDESGKLTKKEVDHKKIIGYDDTNQLFWYPEGIERIVLNDSTNTRLVDFPLHQRYMKFSSVNWDKVFYKTYKERRTWFHVATNFNRVWIIHLCSFWYFTSFNSPTLYTKDYNQLIDNQPTLQNRFLVMSFGGTIACLIQLIATFAEFTFVPRKWPGAQHLTSRLILLLFVTALNFVPPIYLISRFGLETHSQLAVGLSIAQLIISFITTGFFSISPLGALFGHYLKPGKSRKYASSRTFTASFLQLPHRNRAISISVWIIIFGAKFLESYFFLTLSIRDPIRNLSIMEMTRCIGDKYIGTIFCRQQARITLALIYMTDLILYFLDTYLWYILINCLFSVILSFTIGISLLSPWRNVYSRLPKRIYSKVLAIREMEIKYKPKILVSQIWNAIVISMYREHLLPLEMVHRLLYQQVFSDIDSKKTLRSPIFFVANDDDTTYEKSEFFPSNSEAQRRISFFAQSLATPLPEPVAVESMPVFTVLIPHYKEKIILSLKEIIREDDFNSRITLLEYLKQLYPTEWDCFVRDTKNMAIESGVLSSISKRYNTSKKKSKSSEISNTDKSQGSKESPDFLENESIVNNQDQQVIQGKIDDLPFYSVGFKSSDPEFTLRTRIWASLRTQTLYRTVSGFNNYNRALKLLYRVENPGIVQYHFDDLDSLESDLDNMAHRKCKVIIAMQRYAEFNDNEKADTVDMLRAFPDILISYIETETNPLDEKGEKIFYSCLINGNCPKDSTGDLIPRYRIRLSGNPILGDGKSDNQNHSLIFYRGEYIQVVDANQDNYLEECIKIRSLLAEFDEIDLDSSPPYVAGINVNIGSPPVAIVGAREYIFSENIGVLGDVAAGKEQTFGTLFARTLAEIGGKLHYGHPDFLNAIFMTTRGGISKAQKGLHLNEDIYAGMNVVLRGGRIKHCDYYQCGKGRDLGFGSIMNFTTKIGAGMGEQMLSREYYYLGTQLPLDRFLSFYYAHAGFHVNNLFITLSVQMFMIVLVNLGALANESTICKYNKDIPFTDLQEPIGCYNLQPILDWVTIFVFSVFIVFFISFVPLIVQELTERGIWKAISRFFSHILSASPLFEVFVCQIYSNALVTDVTFGGAQYIATGRGFAVSRNSFSYLYSKFVSLSIYSGAKLFLMLLFATLTIWQPALLWFWLTLISMCFAPFIFNPHQFSFTEFFLDYRDLIRWLSRGNLKWHKNSWIGMVKQARTRYTGYKKIRFDLESEISTPDTRKSPAWDTALTEILVPLIKSLFLFFAYTFINSQNGVNDVDPTNAVLRLILLTLFPIAADALILLLLFPISCLTGPIFNCCCCFKQKRFGSVIALLAHIASVIVHIITFELIWFLEGWNFARTLSCLLSIISIQDFFFKFITISLLSREYKHDKVNKSWWSGNWYRKTVGWGFFSQPFREFLVKIMEMSLFAVDFILCHCLFFIQTPLVFIPYFDKWHTMILFWLKPSKQFQSRILTKSQKRIRLVRVVKYLILYFLILILFLAFILVPIFTNRSIPKNIGERLKGTIVEGLIQPSFQDNDDTGSRAPSTIITTTGTQPSISTVFW